MADPTIRTDDQGARSFGGSISPLSATPTTHLPSTRLPGVIWWTLAVLLAAAGAALLFATAPRDGSFWWSDAPRHALNGVFLRDLVAAHPADPAAYAMEYYVRYPALTILFYPPLFYVLSAPFYAVFGVSEATAIFVVALHDAAFAVAMAALARRVMRPAPALAVGLLALAAPGLALWGRQVMLELPMLAWASWGVLLLARYGDSERRGPLYFGLLMLLAAIYTKITAVFLLPAVLAMLLAARGRALLTSRTAWTGAVLFLLGLIPVALLTMKFGQANVQSVAGVADRVASRDTLAGWLWYLGQLPDLLSWPLLALAAVGIVVAVMALASRGRAGGRSPSSGHADGVLYVAWFVVVYLALSAIDLKEARHATLLLPPLLIAAGIALDRLPGRAAGLAGAAAVAVVAALTWFTAPVPAVAGYAEAAARISAVSPPGSVVLFSGKRDGSFIFAMRTLDRPDLATLRSDKLLLSVAVRRELGVAQKDYSAAEIGDLLDRAGVQYVVAQDDFWTDLPVMARLQDVLRSDQFEEIGRIAVDANVPVEDHVLRLLRNRHPVATGERRITLDLPIIGRRIEGSTGAQPGP